MSEWKECKLGDIAVFNYGKSLKTEYRIPGDIPVFSSAGLSGWHNQALVKDSCIIVGRKGTIGKVYYCDKPFWCIDTAYYILPNDKKYNFKFLYYLLLTLGLDELNEDSAVPGLNRDTAYSQWLSLPPLPEQKAIAGVLSSLDDKIDLLHRQNKTLEAMAEALFRQWFVGEADEGWEYKKLEDVAVIQNGYPFSSHDYIEDMGNCLEVLKMGHIEKGGGLKLNPKRDYVQRNEKLSRWILNKGDIVMAMTDMKDNVVILGVPAMIDKDNTYVLNQRVARIFLKSDTELINNYLLYIQLKNIDFIAELQSKANSGVQVNLSTDAIKNSEIIVPPIRLQSEKGSLIVDLYLKKEKNDMQISTLEKLRDTLLPKLMSREVKVNI